LKGLEERMEKDRGEVRGAKGQEELEGRLRKIERRMEKKEREERRKNVIIRGLEVKEGKRKEAVEKILKEIGVKMEVKKIWRISGDREKEREAVGVKIEEEGKRMEIWEKKKKLRERREMIVEDWTWRERKMRWKLEEIARLEERKGKNVWVGYGKIRIEGQWWKWDEEKEQLKDDKGNRGKRKRG